MPWGSSGAKKPNQVIIHMIEKIKIKICSCLTKVTSGKHNGLKVKIYEFRCVLLSLFSEITGGSSHKWWIDDWRLFPLEIP
jgi:hypothetical protein